MYTNWYELMIPFVADVKLVK